MHTYIENILSRVELRGKWGMAHSEFWSMGSFILFLMYDPRTPINQKLTIMSHKTLSK